MNKATLILLFSTTLLVLAQSQETEVAPAPYEDTRSAEYDVEEETQVADEGMTEFWMGFTQSFLLMGVSEIGDRSFIMVTIFAARLNKIGVFILGSVLMVILLVVAVIIGQLFPQILS